jgi:hypothetical protein
MGVAACFGVVILFMFGRTGFSALLLILIVTAGVLLAYLAAHIVINQQFPMEERSFPAIMRSHPMQTETRQAFAIRALTVGLVVGLVGNILFYNKLLGLSFPIFSIVVMAAVLLMFRWAGGRPGWRKLWPLLPILFFAGMVAVRADPLVAGLNILSVLALGGLVLYTLPLERPLDVTPFADQVWGVIEAGLAIIPAAIAQWIDSWGWLRSARLKRLTHLSSVVRGLAIAVPVVVVFGLLLGSADAVFGDYLTRLWNLFNLNGMDSLGQQAILTGALAFAAMGAIAYSGLRRFTPARNGDSPESETDTEPPDEELEALKAALREKADEKRKPAFKLGMIETVIVLGSVDLLFAAFVTIQFAYFFGGQATITVSGLTFAQYARRGFFELVAVSVLTLGLALWLDQVTVRQEKRENVLFRALAVIVMALTSVMLLSASQRMWLYEQAFGFTQLRVYTHVFMLWLGLLFVFYLLAVFRVRPQVFSLGILLCLVGYMGTINLLNVDAYIAERNIARFHDGEELDIGFLNILSSDAVPAVIDLYQSSAAGSEARDWAGNWLAGELQYLDQMRAGAGATVFSAHAGRDAAWVLLDTLRDGLPAYEPYRYLRSYYAYDED